MNNAPASPDSTSKNSLSQIEIRLLKLAVANSVLSVCTGLLFLAGGFWRNLITLPLIVAIVFVPTVFLRGIWQVVRHGETNRLRLAMLLSAISAVVVFAILNRLADGMVWTN